MKRKIVIFSFLGCFSLGITPSLFAQPTKSKEALKIAKEHLKYQEYEQAIPSLRELVEGNPSSAYYNFWLGRCLFETYRKNQSLPFLEKAALVDPKVDKDFHYFYGMSLHYNLKFDEAINEYRLEMQRHEPGTTEYLFAKNRIAQCQYAKTMVEKKDAKRVKISNMGPEINSPHSEHSPVISGNDSIMVFTARRPESLGADLKTFAYDEDVYISYNNKGNWTPSENIGTPVNSKGHDATIALNSTGNRIFIYRHIKDGGIYVSDFDTLGKKWKEPQAVGKPFNSKYYESSVCESADGNLRFFTSNRPGGKGGKDIFLVRKVGKDDWSEPENVGPVINTPFDEDSPYLQSKGKVLYFSSNGPNSMGGFDVFVSEFDSTKQEWLGPLNMGQPVNTPDDDIYFVMDATGENGYYSSGKEGGYGEKDIYHIEFPYFPYPRRYFIIEFTGTVQDSRNLKDIPATIVLRNKLSGQPIDTIDIGRDTSHFYFQLSPQIEYEIEIIAENYAKKKDLIFTPKLEDDDVLIERNYLLDRDSKQEEILASPLEIMNVYFDFDKYELRDESIEELQRALKLMNANPALVMELRGHTDWFGTYDYNVKLSESRAGKVYKYLTTNGIDKSRINITYFSENAPLETNENDDGRQFNRRTEMHFYMASELALESKRLRKGIYQINVDHAMPKGLPGFDRPGAFPTKGMDVPPSYPPRPEMLDSLKAALQKANQNGQNNGQNGNNSTPDPSASQANDDAGKRIRHIYFDFDQSALRQVSRGELDKIAAILQANPSYTIEVHGHTDWIGSVIYNQTLSGNRCEAALKYLASKGFGDKIVKTGFSELRPLDTNSTVQGRQNNRRVEFRIYNGENLVTESQP